MYRKLTLIITLCLLSFGFVDAQEGWTLEQCIKYAFDNNIQIKQQLLNVQFNQNQLLQSKLTTLPSLNAAANHAYNFGLATNYKTNQKESQSIQSTSFSLNSSVTLFNGLQLTNTRKQDRYNLLASVSDVEKVKNNIALTIASAFLQILYNEELVASTGRQVELSRLQVERTGVLVKAGSLPEGNLFEIEAQLASDELQLVNAQNQLDLSYLTLTQLLEIKQPEGFKIQKPNLEGLLEKMVTLAPGEVYQSALQSLPQIASANFKVSSAERGLSIAKGGMSPRLSLNGNYNSGTQYYLTDVYRLNTSTGQMELVKEDPFLDQLRNNASKTIALSLSIPIFNGWQVRNGISNAMISLDNARLSLENEKNILYKDIQQAYTDAIAAQKKLKASQKNLTALEESFRYAEQKLNLGLVTSYDYTNAKNKLSKAEADLLQAKYELIFKTKILEFYKGIPLSL